MSRETLPPPGMAPLPRGHRHACAHWDYCHLGVEFAVGTDCRKCREARRRAQEERDNQSIFHQTNQQITSDSLDAERAALYLAHESGGPGSEF